MPIDVRRVDGGAGETCRSILAELPAWFGLPEANEGYVEHADLHPGVIADDDGRAVGISTVVRHSPHAAEIHLMAVKPAAHRRGVGTSMLRDIESDLADEGVRFLQVMTLSARHPDPGYALTRRFYRAAGFVVLEEFPDLWGASNPALQMIKSIG